MYPKFTTPKDPHRPGAKAPSPGRSCPRIPGRPGNSLPCPGHRLRLRELDTTDEELEPGEATLQADRRGRECLLDHRAWAEASTGGSVQEERARKFVEKAFRSPSYDAVLELCLEYAEVV